MRYTKEKPIFRKFIVYLSSGAKLKIDEDEVDKVMQGISLGQPVKLRQGILNPSFFVSMAFDEDRYNSWKSACKNEITDGEMVMWYPEPTNLPDIFTGVIESKVKKLT